ncbi:PAS domain-containing protein [Chitinivibrio alkaliphilus]|uniref:PAS domain-containing protein n=1 Tax=Chitinivibrio alkaliphilus ACht1 TaxID=1313304 RepID=U7D7J4_9BACT|nr:PAS domain-containing protein [Chitinivibrio alkaliphilus]ERP31072.1 PAS domain-containing protein [Chitinivibrio alkaliphilus ACht1]
MHAHREHPLLHQKEFAYAYHKIIYSSQGIPIDYRFIEANRGYELLTGLSAEDIVGKTVREILPEIVHEDFPWINFYSEIADTKEDTSFSQYFAPLKKWFKITASSLTSGYFATFFTDITPERVIARAAQHLKTTAPKTLNYQSISATFRELSHAHTVICGHYLPKEGVFKIQNKNDFEKEETLWDETHGQSPPPDPEFDAFLTKGTLQYTDLSRLYRLTDLPILHHLYLRWGDIPVAILGKQKGTQEIMTTLFFCEKDTTLLLPYSANSMPTWLQQPYRDYIQRSNYPTPFCAIRTSLKTPTTLSSP